MSAPLGTLICDQDGPWACDCCWREVWYVRGSMWHGDARICRECFYVWYDTGVVDPVEIKDYVLKAEAAGKWPF